MSVIGVNLFMAVCMWIFLPIVYVSMRNNTVCKKNLILSVTLPPEGQIDPEVLEYCAAWRKKLLRTCVILTLTLLPAVFLPVMSVSCTWSMTWLVIAMYGIMRCYGKGYEGLKAIKHRRGWNIATAGQTVVELKSVKLPKRVKTGWFVPPMILSLLPMISCVLDEWDPAWSVGLILVSVTNFLITAMSLLCHGLIYRQRKDVLDGDAELTVALTQVRRRNWTRTWLLFSWLSALYSLAVWFCEGNYDLFFVWSMVYAAVLVVVSLITEFSARRAQQRLTQGRNTMPIVDEDDYWIWGQFYYNPNSNKLMMNERVGMGMSMNMAHPAGKVMAVLTVLILLAMPGMGIWMMAAEMTPTESAVTENTLVVSQMGSRYQIDLDEIEQVEVLETLPNAYRVWGTGMPNLLKGNFTVEGYGSCTLCLDPTDPPFLVVKTTGKTYILGPDNAEELYHTLNP